jgi:Sec-independent protein translocase protein TatA
MNLVEMMLLFLLGFLLFGPKKTSEIASQVGEAMAKIKRTANELQTEFVEAVSLPPEARPDPAIEALRQTIVGVLPASVTAPAGGDKATTA